ncbi:MAG: ECF-type sigma factor [Pirellulaceae bacterium]
MSLSDDVTSWIDGLRSREPHSTQQLWQRYYQRLVELADRRLPRHARREFDEEDVALSAFDSLCRGLAAGRFPDLADRDSLWALLIVITARKARARVRRQTAQKRGGGHVQGESVFDAELGDGIAQQIGDEPTPEFAAQVAEEVESLLSVLPDATTRQLAVLKMEGYTNDEAAQRLACSRTTVERRLRLIRAAWTEPQQTGEH